MAEKATKAKKKGGGGGDMTLLVIIIVVVIVALIYSSFSGSSGYSLNKFKESLHLSKVADILMIVIFVYAIFFLLLISYSAVRIFEIRKKEQEYLEHEIAEYARHQAEKERKLQAKQTGSKNERWDNVLAHLSTPEPASWKVAIIEADTMLDNLLTQLGFKGDNLGEKLKTVDREKFRSLSSAWEVHIVRNKIAHEGLQFELSEREAKRIIALYEQIFREFNYI